MLSWFPGLLAVAVALLTALNLNGSSTGVWRSMFYSSADPNLLLGRVRPIRSDEWLVQSSWVVSQASQGFPQRNQVFPGGMDATLMNDLPTWDWSGIFRPHTWGFLAFGLDHGMAVRWWLPAALMMAAAYFFVVTLLPRRPLLGALLALAVVFQPDVQWWWLPILPNPVAFGFVAMAAVVWGYRCRSRVGRILPAAIAGYLAVDMAMGIYVPFMIPAILALAAFVVGFSLQERRSRGLRVRALVNAMAPLTIAGLVAAMVLVVWIATHRDAVSATLSTVYPGHRVTPPGTGGESDLVSLTSAPFQRWLQFHDVPSALGANQSEASSPLLVSLFLVPPLLFVMWASWRRARQVDWTILAILAIQVLVLAFFYLPGWDRIEVLTGLDRAVLQRTRMIFVILAVVAATLLVRRLDDLDLAAPWPVALLAALVVLGSGAWLWHRLGDLGATAASVRSFSAVVVLGLVALGVLGVSRRRAVVGSAFLLTAALVIGGGVNPLNRGVFDLATQTSAGRKVVKLHGKRPQARWVGIGSSLETATLVEAGVPAYGGVQTYPAQPMWDQIDPEHDQENVWNRLANISWVPGTGSPNPRQPDGIADQIQLTFDSCSSFAQTYVTYVLVDGAPIDQPCLGLVREFDQGNAVQWIYRVKRA